MSSVEHDSATKCNDSTNIDQSNKTVVLNAIGPNPPANIAPRDQPIQQHHYRHRQLLLQRQQLLLQQQQRQEQQNYLANPSIFHKTPSNTTAINKNPSDILIQSHLKNLNTSSLSSGLHSINNNPSVLQSSLNIPIDTQHLYQRDFNFHHHHQSFQQNLLTSASSSHHSSQQEQQHQQQQHSTQINPMLQPSSIPPRFDINSNVVSTSKQSHQRKTSKRDKQINQSDLTKTHKDQVIQHDSNQYRGNSNSLPQKSLNNKDKKRDANGLKEECQPKKRRAKTLEKNNRPLESYHFLRSFIKWCCSGGKDGFFREYTHAPLGEVWAVDNGEKFKKTRRLGSRKRNQLKLSTDTSNFTLTTQTPVSINGGGTFLGRRWIWDEGYYTDGSCYTAVETLSSNENEESCALNTFVPISKRAFCDCGTESMNNNILDISNVGRIGVDGPRRSQREGTSVRMANVLNELAEGGLDPHTLISCDDYIAGPEFRLLQMESAATKENSKLSNFTPNSDMKLKELINLSSETQFDDNTTQPFAVKVCPDAAFVADMHAHLSESEIIGLLGGRYVSAERCLYIQAAFPCKSTARVDAGLTDVEMDPISQIAAGNAIVNQGMTVVGWYHSHPRFQPDPSITDIENQSNYQNLFRSDIVKSETNNLCPFVGLIIGTYGRNPSEKSVMRWFHVTKKQSPSGTDATIKDTPSKRLPAEVYFPMKLNVVHRKMRQYQTEDDEAHSELHKNTICRMQKYLTTSGTIVRFRQELKNLEKSLLKRLNKDIVSSSSNIILCKDAGVTQNNNQNKAEEEKYLLASDSFSSIVSASCDEVEKAMPLPYKRQELEILLLGKEHGVTDDIRAGIIWHAIEREQLCENRMKSKPPNSLSILMLLLSPEVYESVEGSCHPKTDISDDDAIIVHIIDVVLSHYATDARKVNPFESWSNSRDKNINVGKSPGNSKDVWWRSYYCDKILGSNNMKMSKGHKITICLLHWAKHMQLNDRNRWGSINHTVSSIDNHMSTPLLLPNDIEFVSEVMRLFVARWLEASTDPTGVLVGLKKRGKKKGTVTPVQKRRKRRSFQR